MSEPFSFVARAARRPHPSWWLSALAVVAAPTLLACADDASSRMRAPSGGPGAGSSAGAATATGTDTDRGMFGNAAGTSAPATPTGPVASDQPIAPGEECGAVTQMAENTFQPADIIFGVDTSGSMAEEVQQVQANLNTFSQQIIDSGIDVRVIMLATRQEGSSLASGGQAVEGPCIAAPLGSGQCPDDSNPPTYVHVDAAVTSWDVLDVYINSYSMYREHLREDALKTFVTISDDNADDSTHPLAALAPGLGVPLPVIKSADAFIAAVEGLESDPASGMWSDWRYSGIYSFTLCPSAASGAVGVVHQDLVDATGGVAGDLCLQEFAPVFDELARQVVASAMLACDWAIPPPPDGEAFDPGRSNVQLTLDGAVEQLLKAADVSQCRDGDGWHYDDEAAPTKVVACPSTCGRIQAAVSAQVDLQFGCDTKLRPPE